MRALFILFLAACGTTETHVGMTPEPVEPVAVEAAAAATAKINVNTASEAELKAVPGSSDKMAHEFDEYRPYISIRQFRKAIGKYVSEDQVASYEEHLFVPIQFNDCDRPTLRQIAGLDATEADGLMAGRPYADQAAFEAALAGLVSPEELTLGKSYLQTK
jgi:radical SAM superfamily enzyme with C-terminal helix-hairpin-helix motif